MKMKTPLGITCAGLVMGMGLHEKMEPIWLIVAVLWYFMRYLNQTILPLNSSINQLQNQPND